MRNDRISFGFIKRKNNHNFLSSTFLIIPNSTSKNPFFLQKWLVITLLLTIPISLGGFFKVTILITSNVIAKISFETNKNNLLQLNKDDSVLNDSLTKLIRKISTIPIQRSTPSCTTSKNCATLSEHFLDNLHHLNKGPNTKPTFVCPSMGRFSSFFGIRTDPLHETSAWHKGIDIAGPLLTPILCASNGTVTFAGNTPHFGNVVIIDHLGTGFQSVYAHLFGFSVKNGDTVCSKQEIGLLGNTGKSTGPHLHFEIRYLGTPIDPLPFLLPKNIIID